jgi:hypothetical protein
MIKLMSIHLQHFPRHEKYALSQEIRLAAYDVYQRIIECRKKYHNKTSLTQLDLRHEQLRMLINLAFELGYYAYKDGKRHHVEQEAFRRYAALSMQINEIGAMIGGWIRALRPSGPTHADGVGA